jgi:hypothetical protein
MTREEIFKMKTEILDMVSKIEEQEHKAYLLAKKKMFELREGFVNEINGKWYDRNGFEEVNFEDKGISVFFYDTGYDLRDICSTLLSYEEFYMTEEEFDNHIQVLKKEKEIELARLKEEKLAKQREQRLNEFNKLKQEFGEG